MTHLPKLTLKADFFNGDGDIGNIDAWRAAHSPLLRADILQHWVGLLDQEYWFARAEMTKEYEIANARKAVAL